MKFRQPSRLLKFFSPFRPDYAPDSSSGESDEEFIQKKPSQKPVVQEQEEEPELSYADRRLRRLQEARKSRIEEDSDSDDDDDR